MQENGYAHHDARDSTALSPYVVVPAAATAACGYPIRLPLLSHTVWVFTGRLVFGGSSPGLRGRLREVLVQL